MTAQRSLALLTAALVLSAAPAAMAQTDTQPLKGPDVTDRPSTGGGKNKSSFSGEPAGKAKARARAPVPMPVFTKALTAANLTEDQSAKAKSLTTEFEKSLATFRETHKAEIEAAMAKLSAQDRAALDKMLESGRPLKTSKAGFQGNRKSLAKQGQTDADSEAMTGKPEPKATSPEATEARAKLVEIYSQRPKAEETQARILALLNEKQTAAVEAELKKIADARREGGKGKGQRGKGKAPAANEGQGKS